MNSRQKRLSALYLDLEAYQSELRRISNAIEKTLLEIHDVEQEASNDLPT